MVPLSAQYFLKMQFTVDSRDAGICGERESTDFNCVLDNGQDFNSSEMY